MIETLGPLALFSLAAVVFIGLPHGAMDGAVAMVSGYGKTRGQLIKFAVQYTLIAALVVLVWVLIPVFSLTMFMLYSLVHFGLGDALPKPPQKDQDPKQKPLFNIDVPRIVQIICHGGLVVVVIPIAHLTEVQPIFKVLTGGLELAAFWSLLLAMVVVFTIAGVIYTLIAIFQPHYRRRWLECAGLAGALVFLPPLTGFALYFCCVHTPRHMARVIKAVQAILPDARILPLTLGFTIVTWLAMAIAVVLLRAEISFDAAMVQVIFIGLAALTVPHMMLVDGAFRRKLNAMDPPEDGLKPSQ